MNALKCRRIFCQYGCTYMGWDVRSLQRHKATECEQVKKSDTFTFRETNQYMTQILCRNKKHKVKHALNSPGITMVRQSSSLFHQHAMNCHLCADHLRPLWSTYTAKSWIQHPLADPLSFPVCPPVQRQFFSSVSSQVMVKLTQLQSDQGFLYTTLSGARPNPPVTQVSAKSKLCSEQSRQQC